MKTRTILFLAAILAVLMIITYLDYTSMVKREKEQIDRWRLMTADVSDVESIRIQNQFGDFKLEKRAGDGAGAAAEWWMVEPVQERADQSIVKEFMLRSLADARKFGEFEPSAAQSKDFGLDESGIREKKSVVVRFGVQGGESLELVLGAQTPIKDEIYIVDLKEPGKAWVTGLMIRAAFERKFLELLDKTVLDFEFESLRKMTIREGEKSAVLVTLEMGEGGEWIVKKRREGEEGEISHPAGAEVVEQIFEGLKAMPAVDALTSASFHAAAETAKYPIISLGFEYQRKDPDNPATQTVRTAMEMRVARPEEDEGPLSDPNFLTGAKPGVYYANVRGRGLFHETNPDLILALRESMRVFRDRKIFTLEADRVAWLQVERLTYDGTVVTVAMEREPGETWKFANDPKATVHQLRVAQYLRFCQGLAVDNFTPNPPAKDAADAGLDKPELRVTVANADRSRREGLEIGRSIAEGVPLHYARRLSGSGDRMSESEIVAVGMSDRLLTILQQRKRYFTYSPLLAFSPEQVGRIEVDVQSRESRTSVTITVEQAPAGSDSPWRGRVGPKEWRALPAVMARDLLDSVMNLEYFIAKDKADPEEIVREGLDYPAFTVRLFRSDGSAIGWIAFDKAPEGKKIVLVMDHTGKYMHVEKNTFDPLNAELGKVVQRLQ